MLIATMQLLILVPACGLQQVAKVKVPTHLVAKTTFVCVGLISLTPAGQVVRSLSGAATVVAVKIAEASAGFSLPIGRYANQSQVTLHAPQFVSW
jgi:DNA-binding beta-propeller fold protein YncE